MLHTLGQHQRQQHGEHGADKGGAGEPDACEPVRSQRGPLEHVIAGKAVCFGEALRPDFKVYAAQIVANAKVLAEELTRAGFRLTSGGTDNHLVLIDMTSKGLWGKVAENALGRAGITVNKNLIPNDTRKPLDPSGIRMGTAALTTRGLKEDAMRKVAGWIIEVCDHPDDETLAGRVKQEIAEFAKDYPVPSDLRGEVDRFAFNILGVSLKR